MRCLIFLAPLLVLWGCSCSTIGEEYDTELTIPGWKTSSPETQGMDAAVLGEMINYIEDNYNIDSILVMRYGTIISECYFYPHDHEDLHAANSVTKSVVAALIGIAMKEQHIQSIMQSIWYFFPEIDTADFSREKKSITIKDLLTMTSGYQWESTPHNWNSMLTGDIVGNILSRDMAAAPGEVFYYDSMGSHLLSIIIERATGQSTLDFAREKLFDPLGISNIRWLTDGYGHYWGGIGSYWTTRDMAKLGLLYMQDGIWEGERILPPEWCERTGIPYVQVHSGYGTGFEYGFHWWVNSRLGYYTANGAWGQRILVLPRENIVFVMTAFMADEEAEEAAPYLVENFLLKAIKSDAAISEQPESLELLRRRELQSRLMPIEMVVEKLPPVVSGINGFIFNFESPGSSLWSSCGFIFEKDQPEAQLILNDWQIPLGLDNRYRFSPQFRPDLGVDISLAARGKWIDGKTFFAQLVFEDGYEYKLEFYFNYNKLTLTTTLRDWIVEDYGKSAF